MIIKKKDIPLIAALIILILTSILFFALYRQQLKIGDTAATIVDSTKTIFVSLPDGSGTKQNIYFNFPFKNNSIFIKKISSGAEKSGYENITKLKNGQVYDFESFISHSIIIVKTEDKTLEYDLWVTTGVLPVLDIKSDGIVRNEPKAECSLNVLSVDSKKTLINVSSEIELTGTGEKYAKPAFSLNIKENSLTGKTPQVLDFRFSKRFSLSSMQPDSSLIRQKLAYDIFGMLSGSNAVPDSKFVELYLNGDYMGVYLLSERVDRQLLGISDYDKEDKTHSVIYEAAGKKADFKNGIEGFSQIELDIEKDTGYFEPLEELIRLIIDAEEEEFQEKIGNSADINNIIDNHILFLLSGSSNPLASNQYIYRGSAGSDKFRICPGNYYTTGFGIDKNSNNINPSEIFYPSRLYNRLYENKTYRELLKEKWNLLKEEILTSENINSRIDVNTEKLREARERDLRRWVPETEVVSYLKYDEEIKKIKDFLEKRIVWCDDYINNPPLLKIGENYAFINEKNNTIFCSLPGNSGTIQKISWEFGPDTQIYLEPLSCGKYLNYKNNFGSYRDLAENDSRNPEIMLNLEKPGIGDTISIKEEIYGWAINQEQKNEGGIIKILVFDGPSKTEENFLGEADIVTEFETDGKTYKRTGFNLIIDTLYLENGYHDLYVYAYDENGNYSVSARIFLVSNDNNKIYKLSDTETAALSNGGAFDFRELIYHGIMTIENKNIKKYYDFYLTTSDTPVIIITAENGYITPDEKIDATMQIFYMDPEEKNFIDSTVFDFEGNIGISLRGKSTLHLFPKKQYSVEIQDENGNDLNASLLGMPKEADWVLSAPYTDKSLIRIPLAFSLSSQMGYYAPRTEFVELFLNNGMDQIEVADYKGIYILTEKVKRDKNRVNISSLNSDGEELLSGGYLLEMAPGELIESYEIYVETEIKEKYIVKYPNWNNITQKQLDWITDYMSDFENALYRDNFLSSQEGYLKYIDIDSFIDYIIINELFKNNDTFYKSTFLSKDRNGKLKLGPVWDFDLSCGNISGDPENPVNLPEGFDFIKRKVCNRLFMDMFFTDTYIARWKELRKDILSDYNIKNTIGSFILELQTAQERNFQRWQILGIQVKPNPPPYYMTHLMEVKKLENWLLARAKWIDENIDSLHHDLTCSDIVIDSNNCFKFTFIWISRGSNWIKIYDIGGKEVFSKNILPEETEFSACLPDGTYTVKTFQNNMSIAIQEFTISKP